MIREEALTGLWSKNLASKCSLGQFYTQIVYEIHKVHFLLLYIRFEKFTLKHWIKSKPIFLRVVLILSVTSSAW